MELELRGEYFIGASLVVILSTLFGIVIGISFSNESKDTLDIIQSYSALGSFIAAIVTMFIAIMALGSWRNSFNHAEKFKAIVDLERETRLLFLSFNDYFIAHIRKVVHCNYPADYTELENVYFKRRDQFSRSLDFSKSFLSNRESSVLEKEYDLTLSLFESAISMADSNHKNDNVASFDRLRLEQDTEIVSQYERFKQKIRKSRM